MNEATSPSELTAAVTRDDEGRSVVALTGPLDALGVERLDRSLALLSPFGRRPLVLDLTGLTFVDSAGLRAVLRLYGRCLKEQRELCIRPAPAPVQRVFALTRAADVLPFAPGRDESLAAA